MKDQPLAIVGAGMVTGVGLSAPASCAAIRCAISNFQETRFMDSGGEWLMGSSVPLDKSWRGIRKLVKMLSSALRECAECAAITNIEEVPILLCIAEKDRSGRLNDLDTQIMIDTQREMAVPIHSETQIVASGKIGVASAMLQARKLIYEKGFDTVIIAGSDSLLIGASLNHYVDQERLLTSENSNGFIPGEAAAAVVVQRPKVGIGPQLLCTGIGEGVEKATIEAEDMPLRADGMVQAFREALTDAHYDLGDLDFRIADVSGEHYGFKESALVLTRLLRQRKAMFDFWHPADCIGEVGAAIGPVMLSVLFAGVNKGYCPGQKAIAHLGNDDGKRAAMVLVYETARGL